MGDGYVASFLLGVMFGITIMYFWGWNQCLKIATLVPGGLKAWDDFDKEKPNADQASVSAPDVPVGTLGRSVTQ